MVEILDINLGDLLMKRRRYSLENKVAILKEHLK